jgi:hypothetical protein
MTLPLIVGNGILISVAEKFSAIIATTCLA